MIYSAFYSFTLANAIHTASVLEVTAMLTQLPSKQDRI